MASEPFSEQWWDEQFARTNTRQASLYHFLVGRTGKHITRRKIFMLAHGKRLPQRDEILHVFEFFGFDEGTINYLLEAAPILVPRYEQAKELGEKASNSKQPAKSGQVFVPPRPPISRPQLVHPPANSLASEHAVAHRPPERTIPLYAAPNTSASYVRFDRRASELIAPPTLKNALGAYAVINPGPAMEPAFSSGDTLFANPDVMPRERRFVIVHFQADPADETSIRGLVRQLVRWDAEYLVVRQLNPEEALHLPTAQVLAVHLIQMAIFS